LYKVAIMLKHLTPFSVSTTAVSMKVGIRVATSSKTTELLRFTESSSWVEP